MAEMPDNIARLPPKLRERLLKRGILKEQDGKTTEAKPFWPELEAAPSEPPVATGTAAETLQRLQKNLAASAETLGTPPEAVASAEAPGTPPDPAAAPGTPGGGLGTPPEPAEDGQAPGIPGTPPDGEEASPGTPPEPAEVAVADASSLSALSKAAPRPPGSLCKAAAPPPGSLCKAGMPSGPTTSVVALDLQSDLQLLQQKRLLASLDALNRQAQLDAQIAGSLAQVKTLSTAAAKKQPAPVKQVYSSAPVLNSGLLEKRASEQAPDSEPEAKRQAIASPANLRAAAAKAESTEAASWTFKKEDGKVTQIGGQEAPTAKAAQAPAAIAASGASATPATAAAIATMAMPPPSGPPPGPPLPPGWVRVPHEGDHYYWNTASGEVSWDHPAEPKAGEAEPEKEVFKEEHRILWSDLGKVIGRQGINLKIIKESIGCSVNVPRSGKGSKGKGKGKDGKDGKKGKKAKGPPEGAIIGAGDGSVPIPDDAFVTVSVTADTAHAARGGKRCLEVMLGYGKRVEAALEALGVEVKFPKLLDEVKGGSGDKPQDDLDPMDPSSYSDAPQAGWGGGMRKPGAGGKRGGGGGPEPQDSRVANAERF